MIEYFDRPGPDGSVRRSEDARHLKRAILSPQTRVHWRRDGQWDHGRVVEHDREAAFVVVRASRRREIVVSEADLLIRWRDRLHDASALLADGWVESRRYHDARHAFVRAYLAREAGYRGLTAISSSAIEAHPHQIEAIRRVLTDVEPRYLLADEVGLGKTIEAGLLVRQTLLDRRDAQVVVFVPRALVFQWQRELDSKFRVAQQFPGRCHLLSHDALADVGIPLPRASLVVVDEAHQLTKDDTRGYRRLCEVALDATGVLLLSATPLLQEPVSLLRLLHLLAPDVHSLEDLPRFEQALAARDQIASLFGNLNEAVQPVFLRSALAGLREALAADQRLLELLDEVEAAIGSPNETVLASAVRRARSHITEAHRVHSRMIRTRRGVGLAEEFPVLGRIAPHEERVSGSLHEVGMPFAAWHDHVLAQAEQADEAARVELVRHALGIVRALSSGGRGLCDAVEQRLATSGKHAPDDEERELLVELAAAAHRRAQCCPRIGAAVKRAAVAVEAGARVAVATGTEQVAAELHAALRMVLDRPVVRITPDAPQSAAEFEQAEGGAAIVFGPVGEEGQNLQSAGVVIHVDLPWDPNRLEQRLGRFDRFGAGTPCEHVVLLDDIDSHANAWHDVLRDGFGIFAGSIASLQLAIGRLQARIDEAAAIGEPGGLRDLVDWVTSELEQELSAVELAELLDETVLDERGRELLQVLDESEQPDSAAHWEEAVVRWAADGDQETADLRFHHKKQDRLHTFGLTRFDNPDVSKLRDTDLPLVSWSDLNDRFSGAMPLSEAVGTFRRNTATHRGLRLLGPGDPFIDALWGFTEVDDRGRSYALWRARPYWKYDETLFICFDLRIRPDLRAAIQATGRDGAHVEAALRRRAESYLPPITARVWLTSNGNTIQGERLLKILNAPYAQGHGDQTIRPPMWHRLDVHIPRERWSGWCAEQQNRAHELVRERNDLERRCADAAERAAIDSADQAAQTGRTQRGVRHL